MIGSRRWLRAPLLALLAACTSEGESNWIESACSVRRRSIQLPPALSESSGLAASRRVPGVYWSHNDSGGDAAVFAVDLDGRLVGEVRVEGARNRDWEDVAVGPCPSGSCVYVSDTGDNSGRRADVDIYRFPEPDPRSTRSEQAERLRVRYPGGPRDAEALFVLPSGEIYLVTKGRPEPVEVFRYPLPLRPDEVVELERVGTLVSAAPGEILQVTGADASPDGRWVAVRAYRSLMLFRTDVLTAGDMRPALVVDLSLVGEAQGEAVALEDDGTVTLSSEGVSRSSPGLLAQLSCRLPE